MSENDYSPVLKGHDSLLPRHKPSSCSSESVKKQALKRVPIVSWLPQYNTEKAVSDAIAGVTVGLTVIPQGIAYAVVAGLEPQYGLYSAFMGCFAYCVFGSTKDITIGPTAIMALMTGVHAQYGPDYAVLLAFLSGLIILSCGLLRLGFLIDFISVPVIAGFTSAAAITIASSQIKGLLGVVIEHKSHLHLGAVNSWIDVFTYIHTYKWQDMVLGLSCCALLTLLRYMNRFPCLKPDPKATESTGKKILNKAVWFAATARNAIIVIFCLLLAATIDPDCPSYKKEESREHCLFTLTGQIPPGLPAFQPPPFSIANSTFEEADHASLLSGETLLEDKGHIIEDQVVSFGGMLGQLGSAIIIIPLIAILESVAIAKAFAGGKPVDASQEMVALGICNILGSFVQAMPTTGSFSRTAVNSASGVKTPMGGLYTGALVILCLAFLMPYCAFIPKASLAAVIITAVVSSVEYEVVKPIWKSKKTDLIPGLACFLGCLFYELEMGIGLGVVIQVVMVLYYTARPGLSIEVRRLEQGSNYLSIAPKQAVVFPSVSHIRACINKEGQRQDTLLPVVIDCCHVAQVDYTAAKGFASMLKDFEQRGQQVFWLNCSPSVATTIKAIAGELFVPISGLHQVREDEWDGEGKTLLENVVEKV